MLILNLTQHPGAPEQGVTELQADSAALVRAALTFDELPDQSLIASRARLIADVASRHPVPAGTGASAMIGGAPWLMAPLATALRERGVSPVFAFSRRESVDAVQSDGSVRKTAVFRHMGWVAA